MNDNELLSRVRHQFQFLAGFEGDQISNDRKIAYDYYFQRPRGDEIEGRSKAVSGDLSAMVESNLAQMVDALTGKNVAEFHATSALDEDQAQLESHVVKHIIFDKNNGFLLLQESIKEALLARNCFVKVYVEDKIDSIIQQYENVSEETLTALLGQQRSENVEIEVMSYDAQQERLRLKVTTHDRKLRVKPIASGNFFYYKDHDSLDLQEIPICAERHLDSRSDLIQMGFSRNKVNQLPAHTKGIDQVEISAKAPGGEVDISSAIDKSQDLIEWFEVYVRVDKDEDGISELHRVSCSNDVSVLIEDEIVSTIPYATGAVILNPGRLTSISLFDKLRRIQDRNTGLERALFDNINAANKNRLAYLDGRVNEEDVANGRINGAIRVRASVQDVRQAISPFNVPDLSAGILQNIQHVKGDRTELGGAALDLASGNAQVGGNNARLGSQGLDRAYSVMEQIASLYTKTIAHTLVRQIYLLVHQTLRENYRDPFAVKVAGRWQEVSPMNWPMRDSLVINLGKPPGERARVQQSMSDLANLQMQLSEKGLDGVLVDAENFYSLLMDWAQMAEIPNPEQYLIDPRSQQSMQARQAKAAQAERDLQARQALASQAVGLEQMRTALSKYVQDTDLQFKYWDKTMDTEIAEAKIVGDATIDILKANKPETGEESINGTGNESRSESSDSE